MDAIEEQQLRARGARIGDVNRGEWREIYMRTTMAEMTWAVAAAKIKAKDGIVHPADVRECLKIRAKPTSPTPPATPAPTAPAEPIRYTKAPTTHPKAIVKANGEASKPSAPSRALEPDPRSPAGARKRYLGSILQLGHPCVAELADLVGTKAAAVSLWLAHNNELVEKQRDGRRVLVKLSARGRTEARSLGIDVPVQTPTTPQPSPAEPSEDLGPSPADDPPPEPAPAPRAAIQQGQESPLEHAIASEPMVTRSLAARLAGVLRKHVREHGYARTMRELHRCRYLFGIRGGGDIMQYLKVQMAFKKTARWAGSSATARGTWITVALWSAELETSGRVADSATWNDRQWSHFVGVTKAEVEEAIKDGLLELSGKDILIAGYDHIGEEAYARKRVNASNGGKARALAHAQARAQADATPSAQPDAQACAQPHAQAHASEKQDQQPSTCLANASSPSPSPLPSPSIASPPNPPQRPGPVGGGDEPIALEPDERARLQRILAHGGWLSSRTSGDDLTIPWLEATHGLTHDQVDALFRSAQRIAGGALRYPDRAVVIREQLRAEQAKQTASQRRATRERDETEAERASAERLATADAAAAPRLAEIIDELNGIAPATVDAAAKQVSGSIPYITSLRNGKQIRNPSLAVRFLERVLDAIAGLPSDPLTPLDHTHPPAATAAQESAL